MDLTFRALQASDLPLLASWIGRPHIAPWWREPSDLASVESSYGPLIDGSDPTEGMLVLLDDRPIGFVQKYRIDDEQEWRATIASALGQSHGIGIDYLIGEADLVGQGLGRQMISALVEECWERYAAENRIVVDVLEDNVASWKTLESCGFRRVWAGQLESSHPSDQGPSFIYVLDRPRPAQSIRN